MESLSSRPNIAISSSHSSPTIWWSAGGSARRLVSNYGASGSRLIGRAIAGWRNGSSNDGHIVTSKHAAGRDKDLLFLATHREALEELLRREAEEER